MEVWVGKLGSSTKEGSDAIAFSLEFDLMEEMNLPELIGLHGMIL